ncbi:FMN-binding domain protein [Alkaliphilus metalliredigens QYMF]|uniref:FMN-binding domain protein n=2 Tax=Alkaliphilus TaxID=114627 RepID=A6TN16_ALKMQ|nr:FMN-binding domain protein [Alkaliphilus metalliredigens QYMF]
MKKKQILTLLLIMVLVMVLTIGCQPAEEPAPTPDPDPVPDQEEPTEDPEDDEAQEPMTYEDGTYTHEEPDADDRGWTARIEITVDNGEITEVMYDEFDEEGMPKTEDDDYNERWEAQAGISAPEAFPALQDELIQAQSVEGIDVISGATQATERFKEVAAEALEGGVQE